VAKSEDIVAILNGDIKLEHAAIVQTLQHAYAMGEGEIGCELEEIAREEMRHFKWLSEVVVELGGDPTLERAEVYLDGGITERLRKDMEDEEKAIFLYKEHRDAIDDPRAKALYERIIADEEAHRDKYREIIEEIVGMSDEQAVVAPQSEAQKLYARLLNEDVKVEYTVILRYLHQYFTTPNYKLAMELEDQAQESMKHLGWLSEQVAKLGGSPMIEHNDLGLEGSEEEMLRRNLELEHEAEVQYAKHIELIEDPESKKVLSRIRDQETYHGGQFAELLGGAASGSAALESRLPGSEAEEKVGVKDEKPTPAGKLTVGSLLGKKQG
jgi:bacterioferritin